MNAPLAKEQIALLMSDSLTYRTPVVEGTDGTVAEARPSGLARLREAVAAWMGRLAEVPQRRAVIAELNMLTDRELADIGLRRCDVGRVFDARFASGLIARG